MLHEKDLRAKWLLFLKEYAEQDRVVSLQEVAREFSVAETDKGRFPIPIAPSLNTMIGGFDEGNLVIVGGATGQGKTLFALSLIDMYEGREIQTFLFNLEETLREIVEKFNYEPPDCLVTKEFKRTVVYPKELDAVRNREWYFPKTLANPQLEWVWVRLWESRAKGRNPKIVIIDHLHYLIDLVPKNENMSLVIGSVLRDLKNIARNLELVIILNAHTKSGFTMKEPTIDALRDSSFIGQEPDFIFLVWRERSQEGAYTGITNVKLEKNRRTGEVGTVRMRKIGRFLREETEKYEDED